MNLSTYRLKLRDDERTLRVLDKACRAFPVDMTYAMRCAYNDLNKRREKIERRIEDHKGMIATIEAGRKRKSEASR